MTRDTVFRIASLTKSITAAAAMVLVERGWLRLDGQWRTAARARGPECALGHYGRIGGTGTAGYVIPPSDTVVVWMSQVELDGPEDSSR